MFYTTESGTAAPQRGEEPVGAAHVRSCSIFTGGHDASGAFRPVPCDCGVS